MNIKALTITSRNRGLLSVISNLIQPYEDSISKKRHKFMVFNYNSCNIDNNAFEISLEGDNLYELLVYLNVVTELEL